MLDVARIEMGTLSVAPEPAEVGALVEEAGNAFITSGRGRDNTLDLLLPGRDGIELMSRMLRIAEVPVVFLSAYNRGEIIAEALESGAMDYIVKPFASTELVAQVRGPCAGGWPLMRVNRRSPLYCGISS